jgi:hypothetical protein
VLNDASGAIREANGVQTHGISIMHLPPTTPQDHSVTITGDDERDFSKPVARIYKPVARFIIQ